MLNWNIDQWNKSASLKVGYNLTNKSFFLSISISICKSLKPLILTQWWVSIFPKWIASLCLPPSLPKNLVLMGTGYYPPLYKVGPDILLICTVRHPCLGRILCSAEGPAACVLDRWIVLSHHSCFLVTAWREEGEGGELWYWWWSNIWCMQYFTVYHARSLNSLGRLIRSKLL